MLNRLAAGLQAVVMLLSGIMLLMPPPGAVEHTRSGGKETAPALAHEHHSHTDASVQSHLNTPVASASAERDANHTVQHVVCCPQPTPGCCCDRCQAFVAAHFITMPAANVTLISPMPEVAPPIPPLLSYRRLLDPPPVPPPISA